MRFRTITVFLLTLSFCQIATAQEYFGEFRDALKGVFIDTKPRPKFKLESEFRFIDPNGLLWSVPSEKEVDGASIPQAFWSFIGGPFDGSYIKASVIHDYYCEEKTRTEHDTHRNFYYGMRTAGVEGWKAKFMYWAVATFGPKWKLDKRVVQSLSCSSVGGRLVCNQVSEVKDAVVSLASVDLSDPEILATALSKASAVARTLKTTEGKVLDISSIGQISGSLDEIVNSANKYRAAFITKDYINNPEKLGVLSNWDEGGIDRVTTWENNKIPKFNEAPILKPNSIEQIRSGKHFKLDTKSKGILQNQLNMKSLEMKSILAR